jgi:cell division protein FtsW
MSRWWWTVDRWLLLALMLLIGVGLILTFAASPSVAEKLGLGGFHFVKRQIVFLGISITALIAISMMSENFVRRASVLMFPVCLVLVWATVFIGEDIKGSSRWFQLGGFTLQPSEFLKPAFIVTTSWMFSEQFQNPSFPGKKIALGLYLIVAGSLILQPDFGQTILISMVFAIQFIIAGLPLIWIFGSLGAGVSAIIAAYIFVPYVQNRIDIFFDPASGDSYQIDKALNAFRSGGLFGRGPGEGAVKKALPDAHTDFIFAVAGEEFGSFVCLAILGLFAVIVIRGLSHLLEEENPFVLFAVTGLLSLFGLQALINIGVNLAVIPNKGMTLPFISYGGSSLLALAITMGIVLALTRKNKFLSGSRLLRQGGQR